MEWLIKISTERRWNVVDFGRVFSVFSRVCWWWIELAVGG